MRIIDSNKANTERVAEMTHFPLDQVKSIAARVLDALEPFSEQIAIAGSVRRCKAMVHDLDLVIQPKPGQLQAIKDRALEHADPIRQGDTNFSVRLRSEKMPLQIDIFFAREQSADLFQAQPTNFGSLLICRTGSKEHNIYLVDRAKQLGLIWHPYHGVYDPRYTHPSEFRNYIASETEEDIFKALQLDYIKPEERER